MNGRKLIFSGLACIARVFRSRRMLVAISNLRLSISPVHAHKALSDF
jgi:hypothetical protein